MRPLRLLALPLLALALVFPTVAAQQNVTGTLVVDALPHPLRPDEATFLNGTLTVTMDTTAMTNTAGIPVAYTIVKTPEWLSATVSPTTDVLAPQPSPTSPFTMTMSKVLRIQLEPVPDATGEHLGEIEIAATITPAPPGKPTTTRTVVPVRFEGVAEPCDETHATAQAPVAEGHDDVSLTSSAPVEPADTLSVQSARPPIAPVSYAAVAGFAVAGGGVGLLLRRRL